MAPSSLLPPIYAITDLSLTGLSHLEQVERLIAGGATLIQLRDKGGDCQAFYQAAREVMAARPPEVRILINDRVDIALAVAADGVHLGQTDLPPAVARRLLGEAAIIGFSTHSLEQAEAADQLPVDYVALGPIFPTRTKANPSPVVGTALVSQVAGRISKPLVAIGGITLAAAPAILGAGAASVAIISDLLTPPVSIREKLFRFLQE
ncbi:MAG: thiamine phosphate synthase [Blastocatellia bacterium]|nr:thiamine phosphate synthase [Blastocatellia bacterium]